MKTVEEIVEITFRGFDTTFFSFSFLHKVYFFP